ncbi:MAG: ATP-binding protein [Leptospirales bacterium]|nr:ATP-binding protein [Leptospirales bacterium]
MRWLALFVLPAFAHCSPEVTGAARAGSIDLGNLSRPLEIRGEWSFYPARFLSATPLQEAEKQDSKSVVRVMVPGSWNYYRSGGFPDGKGFGTFRLAARVPNQRLSLAMMEQGTAVRVIANGKEVCKSGEPSSDPKTFRPDTVPLLCELRGTEDGRLEILLEVSNFNYRKGGMWSAPVIGERSAMEAAFRLQRELELMVVAIAFIMGLYHVMLYVYHRSDNVPLWFGLFSLAIFVRAISTNFRLVTEFIPGIPFDVYSRLEFFSWFWIPALGLKYTSCVFAGRIPQVVVKVFLAAAVLQSSLLVFPVSFYSHLVVPSQILSILAFAFCLAAPILALRVNVEGALAFFLSEILGLIAVGNDLLHTNEIIRTAHLGPYGLFFVILSQSLIISRKLLRTHRLLIESDRRYRSVIDGSRRLVFSLDREFRFIWANRALLNIVGASAREIEGRDFLDFVRAESMEEKQVIRAALEEAVRTQRNYGFPIGLQQVIGAEPVTSDFVFEVVEASGRWELQGRAESEMRDHLLPRFVRERQCFEITNSLVEAEEISHRLVQNIARYTDVRDAQDLRLGLREIVINAIEHGNLAVSFEDKTRAQKDGDYLKFLQMRCQLPQYRMRTVRIDYSLNESRVLYKITDQGLGFPFEDLLGEIRAVESSQLEHGRGILITLGLFDVVRYKAPGNVVYLIKKFK